MNLHTNMGIDFPTLKQNSVAVLMKPAEPTTSQRWWDEWRPKLEIMTAYSSVSKKDIPDGIKEFIRAISEPAPYTTLLAGGALRDLLNGVEVSDWDLFTDIPYSYVIALLTNNPSVSGVTMVTGAGGATPVYSGPVQYVFQFRIEGVEEVVQLIGVNSYVEKHVLEQFCVSTSGVVFCVDKGFRHTELFTTSVISRAIYVTNATTLQQSYVNKMKEKYKGWTWIV